MTVEGGGACPVGGVWSTGSAGAIGSDCGQVSAIRPNQEVCIYVSALPFSRGWRKQRAGEAPETEPEGREPGSPVWTLELNSLFVCYDLPVFAFLEIKANQRKTPSLSPPTPSNSLQWRPMWGCEWGNGAVTFGSNTRASHADGRAADAGPTNSKRGAPGAGPVFDRQSGGPPGAPRLRRPRTGTQSGRASGTHPRPQDGGQWRRGGLPRDVPGGGRGLRVATPRVGSPPPAAPDRRGPARGA